jgi:predicted ATPase/DNA-binding SARP family transcriptional activator
VKRAGKKRELQQRIIKVVDIPHPTLEIRLLGVPEIRLNGVLYTDLTSAKAQALLYYLAMTGRWHTRTALAGLLWGDQAESAAYDSLRKAIQPLRDAFGAHLAIDRHTVGWQAASPYWVDAVEFASTLNAADPENLQHLLALYRDDFLAGFYVRNAPQFEAWMLTERAHLRELMRQGLATLAECYSRGGDLPQAIATARRLLALEPWREEAHRQLMIWLVQNDQRSAALAQYEICRRALAEELDVAPTPETVALYERIRVTPDGRGIARPTGGVTPARPLAIPLPRNHNLPAPTTTLVGRKRECAAVAALLLDSDVRLVTLTGPPGVGKTRLALETAAQMLNEFADGVWYVELAPIHTPELVAAAIADALRIREHSGNRPLLDYVTTYLRDQHTLLLLDNFEHLLAAATIVSALLAACPRLHILTTTREALRLHGEREYIVPPLPTSGPEHLTQVDNLAHVEAVQLFVLRAQAVQSDFALNPDNAAAIHEICIRLDGLPLAIELAAPRIKLLSPQALRQRLGARFEVLRGGARDAPERHQTLQRAIGWSYALLDSNEQALFRRLAVFVGGFTLAAVEAVCAHFASFLPAASIQMPIFEGVASLVDKSLVQRSAQPQEDEPRFTLLESIREFGLEQVRERAEDAWARHAHAHYYLLLAEDAEPQLLGADQAHWLHQLEVEHENLRAALRWAVQSRDSVIGPRLGVALWHFWYIRSHQLEGRAWLAQLLNLAEDARDQAWLLHGMGMLARRGGDDAAASTFLEESLAHFRRLDDRRGIATSLRVLGFMQYRQGNHQEAQALLMECLDLFRALGDAEGTAVTLLNLAYIAMRHDNDAAHALAEESLKMRRASGNKHGMATALDSLGYIATQQGTPKAARTYFEESLALHRELGNRSGIVTITNGLGDIAYVEQDYVAAHSLFKEALTIAREIGDKKQAADAALKLGFTSRKQGDDSTVRTYLQQALAYYHEVNDKVACGRIVELFVCLAVARGQMVCALQLAGAIVDLQTHIGIDAYWPALRREFEDAIGKARTALEVEAANAAWAEGQAMTLDEAVTFVIATMQA